MVDPRPTLLRATHISKRFGITQALDDVSVEFFKGEVHALMGENGAGKSTLGKIISGLHKQDSGTVTIDGRELIPGSLDDAFAAGVRIVHQELAQCPNLSVAENLCLHAIPKKGLCVDFRAMEERAARLIHKIEPSIDVRKPLGLLSPGHRQICQIAAALDEDGPHGGAKVIVFDEPTSSLSIHETDRLLAIARDLAASGVTVIYVSHRMSEIFACCDRVSVLRDGQYVATSVIADIDEPTLVEQMIGRRLSTPGAKAAEALADAAGIEHRVTADAPVRLRVRDLCSPGKIEPVSFDLRAGEILGIGGLVGAGRSELLNALFGLDPKATGSVEIEGVSIAGKGPRAAITAGMGYVPEDRRLQGLFFNLAIDENILAPIMPDLSHAGIRDLNAELAEVQNRVQRFQVKTATLRQTGPGELSGGNQQKLLIARWMRDVTKVLLLDEPTRGIDVGTKAEVYRLVQEAAAAGLAVLLVSSEMPELLALSDRILVMADGRIQGELSGKDMTQTNIMTLATRETGVKKTRA
ncbi:MAG: sugar ABC transporter ATP-binding protein [Planctomycetota bacterium]|nr:MAG: sugar ABC transporter ATP-binding protein [Planctomycetota bacterium]